MKYNATQEPNRPEHWPDHGEVRAGFSRDDGQWAWWVEYFDVMTADEDLYHRDEVARTMTTSIRQRKDEDEGSERVRATERRSSIQEFLTDEAELLDHDQHIEWLETLTDDVSYLMPLRETRYRYDGPGVLNEGFYFTTTGSPSGSGPAITPSSSTPTNATRPRVIGGSSPT